MIIKRQLIFFSVNSQTETYVDIKLLVMLICYLHYNHYYN